MLLASAPQPASAAGDAFCAAYLIACAHLLKSWQPADLRRWADSEDEGAALCLARPSSLSPATPP